MSVLEWFDIALLLCVFHSANRFWTEPKLLVGRNEQNKLNSMNIGSLVASPVFYPLGANVRSCWPFQAVRTLFINFSLSSVTSWFEGRGNAEQTRVILIQVNLFIFFITEMQVEYPLVPCIRMFADHSGSLGSVANQLSCSWFWTYLLLIYLIMHSLQQVIIMLYSL